MAEKGTVNIHGKEYSTVAYRVQQFRDNDKYKKYAIVTRLITNDSDKIVMKAAILDEKDRTVATGYAEETRTSSQINKTSALENCETSAIGRALAAFGMAGLEYASADEVANAIGQQNAPQRTESTQTSNTTNITAKQISLIMATLGELGAGSQEEKRELMKEITGFESLSKLTKKQASEAIEKIKAAQG